MSRIRTVATTGLNPILDLVIFRPYAANPATETNARGLLTTFYLRVLGFLGLQRSRTFITAALRSRELATQSDMENFYVIGKDGTRVSSPKRYKRNERPSDAAEDVLLCKRPRSYRD